MPDNAIMLMAIYWKYYLLFQRVNMTLEYKGLASYFGIGWDVLFFKCVILFISYTGTVLITSMFGFLLFTCKVF